MRDGIPWRQRRAAKNAASKTEEAHRKAAHLTRGLRKVPPNHNPHKDRGQIEPWRPTRMFEGETVCIIGGGPSLKNFDFSNTIGQRVIAVNNAWELVPHADVLHFADCAWWDWNHKKVLDKATGFKGIICTATSEVDRMKSCERVKFLWRNRNHFSEKPGLVFGWDSGNQAINLAYHMGAAKIVLFGFDMRPADDGSCNFHNDHKRPTHAPNYKVKFIPALKAQIVILAAKGIPVIRATEPGIDEAVYIPDWAG